LWAFAGCRSAKSRDPHGEAELAVEEVAEVADARRPVEPSPADPAPRSAHAHMPGLAAGDQPNHVEQHRGAQDPERGELDGGGEVTALAPEPDHECASH